MTQQLPTLQVWLTALDDAAFPGGRVFLETVRHGIAYPLADDAIAGSAAFQARGTVFFDVLVWLASDGASFL